MSHRRVRQWGAQQNFPGIILEEARTKGHALLHAAAGRKKYRFLRVLTADEEAAQRSAGR